MRPSFSTRSGQTKDWYPRSSPKRSALPDCVIRSGQVSPGHARSDQGMVSTVSLPNAWRFWIALKENWGNGSMILYFCLICFFQNSQWYIQGENSHSYFHKTLTKLLTYKSGLTKQLATAWKAKKIICEKNYLRTIIISLLSRMSPQYIRTWSNRYPVGDEYSDFLSLLLLLCLVRLYARDIVHSKRKALPDKIHTEVVYHNS